MDAVFKLRHLLHLNPWIFPCRTSKRKSADILARLFLCSRQTLADLIRKTGHDTSLSRWRIILCWFLILNTFSHKESFIAVHQLSLATLCDASFKERQRRMNVIEVGDHWKDDLEELRSELHTQFSKMRGISMPSVLA